MNDLIDQHGLQRLIDGSLSDEQRALLLQQAENHPENWRNIALAFVEEQVLRSELAAVFDERALEALPASPAQDRRTAWPIAKVVSLAAMFVLLMGAAVWAGRASVGALEPVGASDRDQDYTILLTHGPGNEVAESRGPNVQSHGSRDSFGEGGDFDTVGLDPMDRMFAPLFDQQSRGFFADHGYTVNEEPVIYVIQGQQGEQYVVPHRNVSFVAHHP